MVMIQENKAMSGQLNDLRLQVERLDYDNKESMITIDILKEQNQDGKNELEELKKTISELKAAQKDASAEDKEKKKQEKMALMMAKFDAVSSFRCSRDQSIEVSRLCSKVLSLRRMNSSVKSSRNWIPSTLMLRSPRCRMTTSSPFAVSWLTHRRSFGRLWIASGKARRRTR